MRRRATTAILPSSSRHIRFRFRRCRRSNFSSLPSLPSPQGTKPRIVVEFIRVVIRRRRALLACCGGGPSPGPPSWGGLHRRRSSSRFQLSSTSRGIIVIMASGTVIRPNEGQMVSAERVPFYGFPLTLPPFAVVLLAHPTN
ncbi:hypothetical protein TorRG33x02_068020 [Trema orientale]|uniref:Uncharacterized protein n=1 Tax=Trema orientale TaxID=63057 RepID=A0A2P5FHQ6_TREOI|nr:hypothetical protein TorRG33x02_068020 [Trema orientale]